MKKTWIFLFLALFIFSGCAWFNKTTPDGKKATQKSETVNQVFYGFPDVPVPKELNYLSEKSFVFETPNVKAGIMVFDGNVDMQSLENYFRIYLPKNGWKFVNSYRYKDVILNFVKEGKTCNIKMTRGAFNTEVEIWVGPADKTTSQIKEVEPK
ncbi:MAG: hypothetical protein N2596_00940 [Syntrophorhabdaceae bacterium]|nr:hypothetical protein [Syntrophorhabdaceae bacterium]